MNALTLTVVGLGSSLAAFNKAWEIGTADATARISFATPELLWQVMTAKR